SIFLPTVSLGPRCSHPTVTVAAATRAATSNAGLIFMLHSSTSPFSCEPRVCTGAPGATIGCHPFLLSETWIEYVGGHPTPKSSWHLAWADRAAALRDRRHAPPPLPGSPRASGAS